MTQAAGSIQAGLVRTARKCWSAAQFRSALLVVSLAYFPMMASGAPRALLIGLDYEGSEYFERLPGIHLDLDFMEQVASDLGITDIRTLWNQEATLDGIRQAIRELGDGLSSDDLTLVYYSGHGTRIPDLLGRDESDGQDEALVPFDARPLDGNAGIENALVDDELGELLSGIGSDRLLLVVDACHSGTAAKSIATRIAVPKAYIYGTMAKGTMRRRASRGMGVTSLDETDVANVVGIMAAQDHEIANATRHGSVLTKALHESLSEVVNDGGDSVTVERLFNRTNRKVAAQLQRLRISQPQLSQHPSLFLLPGSEHLRNLRLPLAAGAELSARLNPPENDGLIDKWMAVAERAPERVEMRIPKETFTLHPSPTGTIADCSSKYAKHLLSIEVVAPDDGYLNVVNAGQGEKEPVVLFPNAKSTQDNFVRKGQRVVIPPVGEDWCLPADGMPRGMNSQWVLVLAAFSKGDLNFYRDGHGASQFRRLSEKSARSFVVAGGKQQRSQEDGVAEVSAAATAHLLIKRQ